MHALRAATHSRFDHAVLWHSGCLRVQRTLRGARSSNVRGEGTSTMIHVIRDLESISSAWRRAERACAVPNPVCQSRRHRAPTAYQTARSCAPRHEPQDKYNAIALTRGRRVWRSSEAKTPRLACLTHERVVARRDVSVLRGLRPSGKYRFGLQLN